MNYHYVHSYMNVKALARAHQTKQTRLMKWTVALDRTGAECKEIPKPHENQFPIINNSLARGITVKVTIIMTAFECSISARQMNAQIILQFQNFVYILCASFVANRQLQLIQFSMVFTIVVRSQRNRIVCRSRLNATTENCSRIM